MRVTQADHEFGRSIADVTAKLRGELTDPLGWVAGRLAGTAAEHTKSQELLSELRDILAPLLEEGKEPNEAMRAECTKAYIAWLANL